MNRAILSIKPEANGGGEVHVSATDPSYVARTSEQRAENHPEGTRGIVSRGTGPPPPRNSKCSRTSGVRALLVMLVSLALVTARCGQLGGPWSFEPEAPNRRMPFEHPPKDWEAFEPPGPSRSLPSGRARMLLNQTLRGGGGDVAPSPSPRTATPRTPNGEGGGPIVSLCPQVKPGRQSKHQE
jgi:hypothetical protein